jgi:dolichol-phosphate mannosyltransferase
VEKEPIFFVDDDSPDHTADEIRRMQRVDSQIHLMARPAKGGYGSACRDAMATILRENLADYTIQSDADLSHPPELLPLMVDMLNVHPVVIGSGYVAGGGTQGWNTPRRLLNFGANFYARALTGVPVHDMNAGFVGYQADVLRRINLGDIRSEGYAFLMEMKFS